MATAYVVLDEAKDEGKLKNILRALDNNDIKCVLVNTNNSIICIL